MKKISFLQLLCVMILALGLGCSRDSKPAGPSTATKPNQRVAQASDLEKRTDGLTYFRQEIIPFSGAVKSTYPNGDRRVEKIYKAGRSHGKWREWYPEGKQKTELSFAAGKRVGECSEWHPNGQLSWRATFWEGQPHGNWDEWESDGLHVSHREFEAGRLVKEVLPEEMQQRIQNVAQGRAQLDQSVWKEEAVAQQVETVFTTLWDELRGAKDKFAPLSEFGFSSLALPEPQSKRTLEWNIIDRRLKLNSDTKPMNPTEWKAWLAARKAEGWEMIESEWHQETFGFKEGSDAAASLFNFVIHAQNEARRIILRGELQVEWLKSEGAQDLRVGKLAVASLRALERTGPAPFVPKLEIAATNERSNAISPTLVKDLNGDGLPEIILLQANELHWNRGNWKFDLEPLLRFPKAPPSSGVIADFNGDDQMDLLAFSQTPMLYPADPSGRFSLQPSPVFPVAEQLLNPDACSAGDVDGDGDLDVWVMQYKLPYIEGQFPTPYYNANDGDPSYLLLNDGRGNFTDATESAGLADKRFRRSFSGSLVDLDSDGDLDLMNVSDFSGLDLYLNDGKGRFTDITASLGEDRFSFGMSHALGDFNGDGLLDFYMTGMGSTTARRLETMKAGRTDFAEHQAHRMKMGYGNRLFLGGKDGFAQAPYNDQVARAGWSWGVTGADFDLDGDRDIFVANGNISRDSAKDYCTNFWRHDIYSGNSKRDSVMANYFQGTLSELGQNSWNGFEHNVFYLNLPGDGFVNVAFLLGVSHEFDSRGVVGADLDADGRPDLLVAQLSAKIRGSSELLHVIKNNWETSGNWIGIRLRGRHGISPLGAVVKLKAGDKTFVQPVITGDSLRSQHPAIVHFGLGDLKTVETLEINWGNGKITRIGNPKVNQYHLAQPK